MNKTLPARVQRCESEQGGASLTSGRAVRRETWLCASMFGTFESNLLRDDDQFSAHDVRTAGVGTTP